MEMEHINENIIKVFIKPEDLAARGVNFLDLIGDQKQIEGFFYSILEEVDADKHFQNAESLTFQVIPNGQGLELYISRISFEEMDEFWEKEISKRLGGKNKPLVSLNDVLKNVLPDAMQAEDEEDDFVPADDVVVFERLDDFLSLARHLAHTAISSSLYYMNQRYYLLLGELPNDVSDAEGYEQWGIMLEYGEAQYTTQAVLEEYGKCLRKDDALQFFAKL
ncbi:MAG: adaptor protein MecA [Aerococcaceae bacterium]|nr:adaptor protein MecA [Aerococcaceae bacterium]